MEQADEEREEQISIWRFEKGYTISKIKRQYLATFGEAISEKTIDRILARQRKVRNEEIADLVDIRADQDLQLETVIAEAFEAHYNGNSRLLRLVIEAWERRSKLWGLDAAPLSPMKKEEDKDLSMLPAFKISQGIQDFYVSLTDEERARILRPTGDDDQFDNE